jgi:ferritin
MISDKIQKAFNDQINAELYSAYLYLSMAAYFESLNFQGFANWMKVQAQEEVVHAMKFFNHINDRNGRVTLKAIEKPSVAWKSLFDAFQKAYEHEQLVTGLINQLVVLAEKEKDYPANVFLQWFVEEQVEEEMSANIISEKLKLAGDSPNVLFMLDSQLGERKFTGE